MLMMKSQLATRPTGNRTIRASIRSRRIFVDCLSACFLRWCLYTIANSRMRTWKKERKMLDSVCQQNFVLNFSMRLSDSLVGQA